LLAARHQAELEDNEPNRRKLNMEKPKRFNIPTEFAEFLFFELRRMLGVFTRVELAGIALLLINLVLFYEVSDLTNAAVALLGVALSMVIAYLPSTIDRFKGEKAWEEIRQRKEDLNWLIFDIIAVYMVARGLSHIVEPESVQAEWLAVIILSSIGLILNKNKKYKEYMLLKMKSLSAAENLQLEVDHSQWEVIDEEGTDASVESEG
jgi:hypothetical protein